MQKAAVLETMKFILLYLGISVYCRVQISVVIVTADAAAAD